MRIASCVNGPHPGGITLPCGRKWPSVFLFFLFNYC